MLHWMKGWFLVAGVGLLAACGGGDDEAAPIAPSQDVVATAAAQGQFSVLAEALAAADLVGTLQGEGPYTVFAPTDAAFAALLSELGVSKEQLLSDTALLTTVLTYHVVPGKVMRADVPVGKAIATVQGNIFKVDAVDDGLSVTDGRNRITRIVATDTEASNGVIHTVDRVLLPADRNIVETAISLPQFSILVEAVLAADLQTALSGEGPLTVFAPTNDAFVALLAELGVSKGALLADVPLLTRVLTYHVVDGRVLLADVPIGAPVATLQGGSFTVGSDLAITDAQARSTGLAATDVLTSNGVIHVLDRVLLPPTD